MSTLWFVTVDCLYMQAVYIYIYFCDLHFTLVIWLKLTAVFFISLIFLRFTQFQFTEMVVYDCYAATLIDALLYVVWFHVAIVLPRCCGCLYILADFIARLTILNVFLINFCCDGRFTFWQFSVKKCSVITFLNNMLFTAWAVMYFAPFLACCVQGHSQAWVWGLNSPNIS